MFLVINFSFLEWSLMGISIVVMGLLMAIVIRHDQENQPLKCAVETSLMVAFAFVLNLFVKMIPFLHLTQGGSISFALLPIIFISLRRGVKWGILAGFVYGLIDLMVDGEVFHPLSIFLDYLLAYSSMGLAGIFKNKVSSPKKTAYVYAVLATIVAFGARFIFCLISGALLFGVYAPEGMNPWVYSFLYNGAYLGLSAMLCSVLMCLLKPMITYYKD